MAHKGKHLVPLAILYFVSIFIFAAVYYFNWITNTSGFIVNNEFNEFTVDLFSLYEKDYNVNAEQGGVPFSIDKMNEEMVPFFRRTAGLQARIADCEKNIIALKLAEDTLAARMERSHDQNLNQVLADSLRPFQLRKDSLEGELAKIPAQGAAQTAALGGDDSDVKAARLRFELARCEYDMFKLTSEIQSQGLRQRLNYIDRRLIETSDRLNVNMLDLYQFSTQLNDSLLNTRSKIRSLIDQFHRNRVDKVRFVDFIYFSVVTATSTGYGDIIPNNRLIRIIVTVQVLFSLTIFGMFLAHVTRQPW